MKNILTISIFALFLIIGIGCVSAADFDMSNIHNNCLAGTTPSGGNLPHHCLTDSNLKTNNNIAGNATLGSGLGGGENQNFYLTALSINTPIFKNILSYFHIGEGDNLHKTVADLNINHFKKDCFSHKNRSGLGGGFGHDSGYNPNIPWPDISLYGPTPENHNLQ